MAKELFRVEFTMADQSGAPRKIKAFARRVAQRTVDEVLRPVAAIIADKARELVPTDTGETLASIHVRVTRSGGTRFEVDVVAGGPGSHAVYVEFGTIDSAGRHFMRQAALETDATAQTQIDERLSRLVREELQRMKA